MPDASFFPEGREGEFEPDRGGAPEWVGFALGLLVLVIAGAALMRGRAARTG